MAERSKRIVLHDEEKLKLINDETKLLLKKYKVDMSLRELSSSTQYHYEKDLEQWFIYILDNQFNQSVTELTEDDITEFLYFCKQEGNNANRMKVRMAVISAFYKFLRKKRLIKENPVEFLDRPKSGLPIIVQTFLTKEQVALMREKLINRGDIQLRTYALFSLSTMARVHAVATIKWQQIDFEDRVVKDVLEKEGKVVELFFSEEVKDLLLQLQDYRRKNNINDYGWVFCTQKGTEAQPISCGTLGDWCKTIGRMIDVPTLHPHDFRHSGASLLKNAGMPLEDISVLLHHESTDTTKRFYIREDRKRITMLKDMYSV